MHKIENSKMAGKRRVLSTDLADRPFVALIAVVNSSLFPVGRVFAD